MSVDLARFERCRNLLAHNNVSGALRELSLYEREMPRSNFAREREVLWIRALLMAGQGTAARKRSLALARSSP